MNTVINGPDDSQNRDEHDPTPDEMAEIRKASPTEAAAVDALILAACSERWQKVAKVVGVVSSEFEATFSHLPSIYVQVRILELVHQGVLEDQGDVMQMRASEIRLARPSA